MLLRPARPDDALAVARVHVRSWQAGYRTLLPADYLAGLRPEERAARYDFGSVDPRSPATIVALEAGLICGFATTAAAEAEVGELSALYVDPDCWGRGIGAALVSAARARLAGLGFRDAVLWLLAGNTRAERFYRRDGWAPDGVQRRAAVWGVTVDELRYRRALEDASAGSR